MTKDATPDSRRIGYPPKQAARFLGVSVRTVRRWCKEGRIGTKSPGQGWLIRRFELVPLLGPDAERVLGP